jgi:non-canonical (house-cleaning) NTP pyrophosphatase
MMSLAAADNITQRKLNSYFVRASATSSQAMHPMGHFAATEMKLKRVTNALLPQFGDYAVGLITACPFTIGYDSDAKRSSRR